MSFTFTPAVRENTPIVMAIAGPSGSGKTFTALELAMGLAGVGKIALIDTEGRRGLHYADLKMPNGEPRFRFDHCDFRAPYTPVRFLDALKAAEGAGYSVIVTDSFSDEYVGEGGLVDMAAAQPVENTAAKWAKPKAQHKLVIRWLRQSRCHLIFCIRAEEKVRLEKVFNEHKRKEEVVIVPIGWQPIAEKNTMYDMTASFMLHPEEPGVPHPIKLQEQHRPFFPAGNPITRESGIELAAWAAGGVAAPPVHGDVALLAEAEREADKGAEAFRGWWRSLRRDRRDLLRPDLADLQIRAEDADSANTADDPFGLPPLPDEQNPPSPTAEGAGEAPTPSPSSPAPPRTVVPRRSDGGSVDWAGTCDDLIYGIKAMDTVARLNGFLKRHTSLIDAMPADHAGRVRDEELAHLQTLRA